MFSKVSKIQFFGHVYFQFFVCRTIMFAQFINKIAGGDSGSQRVPASSNENQDRYTSFIFDTQQSQSSSPSESDPSVFDYNTIQLLAQSVSDRLSTIELPSISRMRQCMVLPASITGQQPPRRRRRRRRNQQSSTPAEKDVN